MAYFCPKPVRACAMRATLLDECGAPVDTTTVFNSQVVTKQFISLSFSPDIEEGETFRIKNACGDICINDNSDCDRLIGFDVTLQLCGLEAPLMELVLGMSSFVNGAGDTLGGVLPPLNLDASESALGCNNNVMLEVWSRNSDRDACAAGNDLPYVRWFLPLVRGFQLSSDTAFANDVLSIEMTAFAEESAQFNSPVGLANDPDLTQEFIDQVRAGGPLAFIGTDTIPAAVECDYVNPN